MSVWREAALVAGKDLRIEARRELRWARFFPSGSL